MAEVIKRIRQTNEAGEVVDIVISREDTPAGSVVYREVYDSLGKLIQRDVEHMISAILAAKGSADIRGDK